MRKIVLAVLIFLLSVPHAAQGAGAISLSINGKILHEASALITIVKNRVFVPVRFVAESLGAQVEWFPGQNAVEIKNKKHDIILLIGNTKAYVDGKETELESPPRIVQDRCIVPVRFISEALGMHVNWNQGKRTVSISTFKAVIPYTEEDLNWLAKIIEAESGGEPMEGKIAVGAVIVHRVQSSLFPKSIKAVIFQKSSSGHYQFSPVATGKIYKVVPSKDSYEAAKRALAGEDPSGGATYFYNPVTSKSSWMLSRSVIKRIGNHVFAK